MEKTLSCRDLGIDCNFVAHAETDENLIEICEKHTKTDHGISPIPSFMHQRMKRSIRQE